MLSATWLVGVGVGVAGTLVLPPLVETSWPDLLGHPALVEGQVLKKQRESTRVLLNVQMEGGPVLAAFTRRVVEIDLLVEPVPRGHTFVDDPTLERGTQPVPALPGGGSSPPG